MEELKDVITKTLEKQGILTKIRAELRASVFQAIDDEEGGSLAQKAANPRLQRLMDSPNGLLMVCLVREFMSWAGLGFTVKVFDPEVALTEKLDRDELQERLGMRSVDEHLPLVGALLESFLSRDDAAAPVGRAPSAMDQGLRGPRPDPLTVTQAHISPQHSGEMPSPYDVTTPSSAFLGQDDPTGVKKSPPPNTMRGKSPLGRRFDGQSSGELEKSVSSSFEIEDDGVDDEDADIEYEDDLEDEAKGTSATGNAQRGPDAGDSGDLHTSTDSMGNPRLEPIPSVAPLVPTTSNPLDKPRLIPPAGGLGALAPLGKPREARLSSDDIKKDLLQHGLITSPSTSQELDSKQLRMSADFSEASGGIQEEISVVTLDEVDDFYDSEGALSDAEYSQAEMSAGRTVGASMEFHATGLSISDRSGELDALDDDADLFESAISIGSPR